MGCKFSSVIEGTPAIMSETEAAPTVNAAPTDVALAPAVKEPAKIPKKVAGSSKGKKTLRP